MVTLVTGSTGFVGGHVLRHLLDRGERLRLVSRDANAHDADVLGRDGVEVVTTSDCFAESAEWWASTCENIDRILHLAWYVNPSDYLVSDRNLACVEGTFALAQGAVAAGVRRFVGIGTCFEYDLEAGRMTTLTPLKPTTLYAAAKVALYQLLKEYFRKYELSFAWCRLFYLYGEGEDPRRLVRYVRDRLEAGEPVELTSGNQVRDFTDVADASGDIIGVLDSDQVGPVNICSGNGVTVREFVEGIADEYGRRDLLRFGARPDNLVDPPVVVGVR